MFPYIDLAHFPSYDFFHSLFSQLKLNYGLVYGAQGITASFRSFSHCVLWQPMPLLLFSKIIYFCAPLPTSPVFFSFYYWTSHQSLLLLPNTFCFFVIYLCHYKGFSCGSAGKESTWNVRDLGSVPGLGISPGEGEDYPLQYSGLENSVDNTAHDVTKSRTRLSDFRFHYRGQKVPISFKLR